MPDRPFVDRRLAFHITFKADRMSDQELVDARDTVEEVIHDSRYSLYVSTSPPPKNKPPQFKVILSESNADPDVLSDLSNMIESELDMGQTMRAERIQVVSAAISPEGKVKNAISFK